MEIEAGKNEKKQEATHDEIGAPKQQVVIKRKSPEQVNPAQCDMPTQDKPIPSNATSRPDPSPAHPSQFNATSQCSALHINATVKSDPIRISSM